MVDAGLVEEVRSLIPFKGKVALKTVGYKELFGAFSNEYEIEEAIELIKRNTRRYAKRQITWFKRDDTINWFTPKEITDIIVHINSHII